MTGRIRLIGPADARIEIEVPDRDEIQEQIDFIRWVTEQEQPRVVLQESKTGGRDGLPGADHSGVDPGTGAEPAVPTVDPRDEALAAALARIAELEARAPEVRTVEVEKIVERVVEVSSPEAATLRIIPEEIAAMMDEGETFTHDVRRKLTERLNVELAELKNLRGLAGEDLKREAEIEKLLGLFARLGEI